MNSEVRFKKTELHNKLRILSEEVPGIESFALGFCIKVGSRDDIKGLEGIAHFVEHAAFLNTKTRNYKQIASQFESLGAYTNAFTTKEHTCFYVRALKKHFNKTFELLADIVFNPIYILKSIEKEKQIIIEEIRSYEDDPEELIFDYADEITFTSNGLSHPIVGKELSVLKITPEHLTTFHSKHYIPRNIIISSAGCLKHEEILKACDKYINGLICLKKHRMNYKKQIGSATQKLFFKKPFHQSHLILCRQTEGIRSSDRYPLSILNIILGDGMSSRLYQLLREKFGLAYSCYSTLNLMADCGSMYIYAAIDKNKIEKTKRLIKEELDKFINKKISLTEIKRAKEQIKSTTLMSLESMNNRMQSLAKAEFSLGKYEDILTLIKEIDKINVEEIYKVGEKYFKIENWNEVVFLPE